MEIFHRRPLFFLCTLFMLASLTGLILPPMGKCILGGLMTVGTVLYALLSGKKKNPSRAAAAVMAGLMVCLALLQSHQTFDGSNASYLQSLEYASVRIEGTVTDRRGAGGNLTAYALSLRSVNGRQADGTAVLTCYYVSELQPGYEVELEATLIPLEEAVGDGYDATSLRGDGYVCGLLSEDESTVTVLQRESDSLLVRAGNLRRTLAARLNLLTGDKAKGIPSALLLGDKSALEDDVRRDFSRAGISHILAISGLHMTLLFGLLEGLFRFLRMPGRLRALLLGAGVTGYLLLLGFPPSATRAAVMLGVTYLSYLLSAKSDPLTSLGLAGAVILAVTPYAVADAGFWMSFLATLGILTVMPITVSLLNARLSAADNHLWQTLRRPLISAACAVAVGIVAMSFTLTVVAAVIGEMGILSPLSTLLATPFCAVIAVLSLICLPFMDMPAGYVLGDILGDVADLMSRMSAQMGTPSWAVVSLRHPLVLPISILMLAVVLLLLSIRLPVRRRWLVLLPILAGWTLLFGVMGIHRLATKDEVSVTFLQPSSVSDNLVLVSGNTGFICDLSNGSLSAMTAAAREAKSRGATELGVFMLTHYHNRTAGSLSSILDRETVRALWMPIPENEEEYYLLAACLDAAEAAGVPVILYGKGDVLGVFGRGTLTLETAWLARSVQPVLLLALDVSEEATGKDTLVYCGSAVFESELADRAAELISTADTVIFGSHGPLFKAAYGDGLDLRHAREIIFSAYGDAAPWFDPAGLPEDPPLWRGQKRLTLYR